jgi:class 3 adenylate cyclase/tetratricopeptide (TPR) repeat protein
MAEARKTVTVVFSDVAGSTSLGEQLDPEALRRVMQRYFAETQSILERHGGTVEKFIGDAVMSVFGIPTTHEDDALRAVRAADEIRGQLKALNDEFGREHGVSIAIRTGISTGEVVAGDPESRQSYATGDAVNVAARLEQTAEPGEILLSEQTYRLVRDAVRVEPARSLTLKGKAEPVVAYGLVEVVECAPALARRFDTPFVGRSEELSRLVATFERSVAERKPTLSTVLGPAGIGKTRLAAEFTGAVQDRATVLQGRCLPYGEGITFWPLEEILRSLPRLPPGAPNPERARSSEETFWSYRKLFEALAQESALLLVVEDIHWAEPSLLELLEHIVEWTRDAPMLLLCLARPELIDERPGWSGEVLELDPLPDDEATKLVASLGTGVGPALQARATEVAEGNPLFLEQLVALASENGQELAVPHTIQALLAARLDHLEPAERSLLEAAAVIGKEFWRDALLRLAPDDPAVSATLQRLVRRRLIRPGRSSLPGEDAFRFAHMLVRDAAYQGIAKKTRADLHERFAHWLESGKSPYLEIIGYHLEQAYRYRSELGMADDALRALGDRAGTHLERAGRRAFLRGDARAAVNLIGRARGLLIDPDEQLVASLPLADALEHTGELGEARALLGETILEAEGRGDRRIEWLARIGDARIGILLAPDPNDRGEEIADQALGVFEELGDDLGIARALTLAGDVLFTGCRYDEAARRLARAVVHAGRTDDDREQLWVLIGLVSAMYFGSSHVDDVQPRVEELLARVEDLGSSEVRGLQFLAGLHAMRGLAPESKELYLRAKGIAAEMGLRTEEAVLTMFAEEVGLIFGDPEFAEREFRRGYEVLERMGERGLRSTVAAQLAEALYALGRHDEVADFAELALELASSDDIASQSRGRAAKAKSLAVRGEHAAAERLAREAVSLAQNTDSLFMRGQVLIGLAEVLRVVGRFEDAIPALDEAVELSERKGNVATAGMARARRHELQALAGRA